MGVCGTRFMKHKVGLYWHYLWRREDCPVVEAAGHAGQRCARVLALRPLDPPRARSWRLHRRRRRRRVAIWRSRAGGWTVPRRRRLYTCVYCIGLGVKFVGAWRRRPGLHGTANTYPVGHGATRLLLSLPRVSSRLGALRLLSF